MDSQAQIVAKLDEALREGVPSKLYLCRPSPDAPSGGVVMAVSRFDMILSGTRRVELNLAGEGRKLLLLKKGDAYMGPPGAWEHHFWDTVGEMLCIVLRKDYLRVSYYDQTDAGRYPEAIYHHTMRLPPATLLSTIALMEREDVSGENPIASLSLARAAIAFAKEECSLPAAPAKGRGAELFDKAINWLEDHFQEDVSLESAAAALGMGADNLAKLFRRFAGCGLHEHLTSIRMDLARHLLTNTDMDVKILARQCGYKNHVHFTRRFREINGAPPCRYRLSCGNKDTFK